MNTCLISFFFNSRFISLIASIALQSNVEWRGFSTLEGLDSRRWTAALRSQRRGEVIAMMKCEKSGENLGHREARVALKGGIHSPKIQ